MSDLTKLTADELMESVPVTPEGSAVRAEIRRRLERLEQCEAQAQQHLHIVAAYEQTEADLKERLEQYEALCKKYAFHWQDCSYHDGFDECSCGYAAARAALEETK